ncbi:MAG: hypothetical protein QW500_00840 [Candidatus Micrarchaeia archaeon]
MSGEKWLLEYKKKLFLKYVDVASKSLGYSKPPQVKFWEGYCPNDKEDELAHIHLESGTICVSIYKLINWDETQIQEIATHEVAHLVDASHQPSFMKVQANTKQETWKLRVNVPIVNGNALSKTPEVKKKQKRKTQKKECQHYDCNVRKDLKQCSYCGDLYCQDHLNAKSAADKKSIVAEPPGHICPQYYEYHKRELERRLEQNRMLMDRLLSKPTSKKKSFDNYEKCRLGDSYNKEIKYDNSELKMPKFSKVIDIIKRWGIFLLILFLLVLLVLAASFI